jgi:hypothetical protein
MSDRECNYCTYQYILSKARQTGRVVTTAPKEIKGVGTGVDVYVNSEWVCWFMELPDHCCC